MPPGRSNTESQGLVVSLGRKGRVSLRAEELSSCSWDHQCSGNFQKKQLSKVSEVSLDATVQGGRAVLSPALCSAKLVQPDINYSSKKREEPVHIDSSYLPGVFLWWSQAELVSPAGSDPE